MAAGIDTRHARSCRSRAGGRCSCTPSYQAYVYDRRNDRLIRKTFPAKAEAKTWRQDAIVALRRGIVQAPVKLTVREGLRALLDGMRDGTVLDRSGKPYKPATCRSYEQAIRRHLEPALGSLRLDNVRRRDVQALVDRLRGQGLSPSTVHNKLDPLRVLFRRAVRDELIAIDPTDGLELPAVRPERKTVASRSEAEALVAAAPTQDRALWACAFYAGLRRGELRALRWAHVDFDAGVIRAERGWDDVEGDQDVKTDAGRRTIPLAGVLRRELAAHKLRTGRADNDLVFGRTPDLPFVPSTVRRRALTAWRAAGLEPMTPHAARHTFASYLIASGMNPKQVQTFVGHTDIRTTFNVYGHLLPGDVDTARQALDTLLESSVRESRAKVDARP
jgi:integrase